MLKIHKGLKKKKKDKKHKRKEEDDLFDEEELERYRREHQQQQQQQQQQGFESGDQIANESQSSANSDEWQKFKALTAGIDCVLQKTQEDLDRIKSTSFFQRKPVASEVASQNLQQQETGNNQCGNLDAVDKGVDKNKKKGTKGENNNNNNHNEGEKNDEISFEVENEEEEFVEEEEEEEDIFNTSYVDAVASGELKLAYIPDSPTEETTADYDPFDTSIADKFIVTNPKKRYLNLGCAVQVLSGRTDKAAGTGLPITATSASKRRIVRPVQLLLDSFDEGSSLSGIEPIGSSLDSPVKTLLDEDPAEFGDKTPTCEVLPLPLNRVVTGTQYSPSSNCDLTASLSPQSYSPGATISAIQSLSLAEFETLPSSTVTETAAVFKQNSIESCGSIDDEFATLAQTRRLSNLVAAPASTVSAFVAPLTSEGHKATDPFDTTIVENLTNSNSGKSNILDSKFEAPIPPLGYQSLPAAAIIEDDNDFDPRADNPAPAPTHQSVQSSFEVTASIESPVSPTGAPTFDVFTTTISNEHMNKDSSDDIEHEDDYDPFDTSHVTALNTIETLNLC